jgi:transcriptional regulator with XRE-family HTH domain
LPKDVRSGNIARLRKAKGLTQAELGKRIKPWLGTTWTRQTVGVIEAGGRSASASELVAFGQILDAPLSGFFEPEHPEQRFALPGGRSVDGRTLLAAFMSKETQGRLGRLYELGAVREHAGAVRAIGEEAESRLDLVREDLQEIDYFAGLWDQPKRRKPPRKRKKGGAK